MKNPLFALGFLSTLLCASMKDSYAQGNGHELHELRAPEYRRQQPFCAAMPPGDGLTYRPSIGASVATGNSYKDEGPVVAYADITLRTFSNDLPFSTYFNSPCRGFERDFLEWGAGAHFDIGDNVYLMPMAEFYNGKFRGGTLYSTFILGDPESGHFFADSHVGVRRKYDVEKNSLVVTDNLGLNAYLTLGRKTDKGVYYGLSTQIADGKWRDAFFRLEEDWDKYGMRVGGGIGIDDDMLPGVFLLFSVTIPSQSKKAL
jgi:hypothetical protein